MKALLIRFEKEILHYMITSDLNNIETNKVNMQKETINSKLEEGEKYQQLLKQLELLISEHKPYLFIFHAGSKYMGKIDEIRYAHECFLQYLCSTKDIKILGINKVSCRKLLNIKQKDFGTLLDEKKTEVMSNHKLAKSHKMLEGLALLCLVKGTL